MDNKFGFVRILALSPKVKIGNPKENVAQILSLIEKHEEDKPDIILLPELAITGYTCANLFQQSILIEEAKDQVLHLARKIRGNAMIVVGCPVAVNNSLYNCAVVIQNHQVEGIVPKQYLPNYREFYELRWFRPADGKDNGIIKWGVNSISFGTDLLFVYNEVKIGVEVCEDLWMPIPPSSYMATAGATILLNCSASNETVGKANYRRQLIAQQSGRCIAAYAYSSCGITESTTDVVFGGHCLIAENGSILEEGERFENEEAIMCDVDVHKLLGDRRSTTSFDQHPHSKEYREIQIRLPINNISFPLSRDVNNKPFVPKDSNELNDRCEEIFSIQVSGLMQRLKSADRSSRCLYWCVGWFRQYFGVISNG
jgi:NAD+ synthase (glutamine-hydrolysing)